MRVLPLQYRAHDSALMIRIRDYRLLVHNIDRCDSSSITIAFAEDPSVRARWP